MAKAGDAWIDVHGNFAPFAKEIEGLAASRVGKSMQRVGKSLTAGVTLPLVGLGAAAIKLSRDFGGSMRLISTQAGASRGEMERMKKAVLGLTESGAVKQSPKELADALFHVESVGYRGSKALGVLKSSADLAAVGQSDLEETTYALVSSLETGIKGTENLHKTIGTLNAIVGTGDMRMEDLTNSLSSGVLVSANQVGLSLRDVGAALDTMTARGMPAQVSATRLRMTFSLMAAPTTKAKSALESIGLSSTSLAEQMQKPAGLLRALSLLKDHLAGLSKVEQTQLLSEAFGGARSGTTMMLLLQNLDDVRERFQRIGASAGNFGEKLKEVKEASGFKLDVAWSQLQAALIHLGDELLPVIVPAFQDLVGVISRLGRWFNRLPEGTKKLIVEVGLVAAALGPVLFIGGKLVSTYAKVAYVIRRAAVAFGLMNAAEATAAGAGGAARVGTGADMFGINAAAAKAAGGSAARNLAAGLARTIGPAVAAYGIGNIVTSATSGDWRDAGFEAGGALAGGVAGFMLGGPFGAMLGVGLGSLGGELGSDLFGAIFDSGESLSPLQQRLAQTAERVTEAFRTQAQASQNLVQANQRLNAAQAHQREVNAGVKRATEALAAARKRYGENSAQAARAEARLRNQKALSIAADRRAASAERLHGVMRTAAIRGDRAAVAATKERTEALSQQYRHLVKLLREQQKLPPGKARLEGEQKLQKRLNETGQRLTATRERETKVIREAAGQIGGRFARSLERLSASQLRVIESGRTLKQANEEMAEAVFGFSRKAVTATSRAKGGYERLKGVLGPFRSQTHEKLGQASGDIRSWSEASTGGINVVETSMSQFAQRLGISKAQWGVMTGTGRQRGGPVRRRQGGGVVPGQGDGDTVDAALPWGAFVLNKRATAAFGFRAGGLVPVRLEPGERWFHPDEVRRVGSHNLDRLNRAVPRFQQGGEVQRPGGELSGFQPPVITGREPLRSVGQRAVNKVFEAAVKALQRAGGNRTYAAILKEANRIDALHLPYVWGGGHQSTPAPPDGPFDCSGAISALFQGAGFQIPTMVSSGFESFGLAGKGKVSVLANPEHVYSVLGGRAWGTSEENPGGGAGWIDGYTYRGGFTIRHPDLVEPGKLLSGRRGRGQPPKHGFARGGWVRVGATIDPSQGNPAFSRFFHGGMSFAELLQAGANRGLRDKALTAILGLAEGYKAAGQDYGMAMGTALQVRMPGGQRSFTFYKNDVGSGQGGDPHYKVDLHSGIANALGWHPNEDIEVSAGGSGGGGSSAVPTTVHGKYPSIKAVGKPSGGLEAKPVTKKYEAQTKELTFGALPKSEEGCLKELYHLEKVLLPEYRAAVKQHPDKATSQALLANQKRIEKRIHEVRGQLRTLRIAKAKKRLTKRLQKALRRITGWEEAIETAQRAYETASQYAEQVVGLEPVSSGEVGKDWVENVFAPYVRGTEEPAYGEVLAREAAWRNTIIRAQTAVGNQEHAWGDRIGELGERITALGDQIDKDNRRIGRLRDLIREHPNAKDRPAWEGERDRLVNALPGLHQFLDAARGRRKQFVESLAEAKTSWNPWQGTGSFEDSMVQVQGLHWPAQHELLAVLPAVPQAGMFGGAIWDTQTAISELGLKITQALESASSAGPDTSERDSLLEQLWREEAERLAISQAQYRAFEGFTKVPNFGGSFAKGGIVPGRAGEPRVTITHGGEGVFTPDQMAAIGVTGAERPTVLVHGDIVSSHPDPVELLIGDKRFPAAVEKVTGAGDRRTARVVSRRMPSKAGVFGG